MEFYMEMKLSIVRTIIGAVLILLADGPQSEVSGQTGQWMRVDIVQLLPDRLDDYLELQFDIVNPALRRAGVEYRSAWRTAEFGNTYERLFVTPIDNFSDYDSGGPLARAMAPDDLLIIRDRVRRCTASRKSYAIRYHPSLSVDVNDPSGLFLARVVTVQIVPGQGSAWEAFLKNHRETFRDTGLAFDVYERVFGPGPASWQIVENYSSYASLEQPTILERAFRNHADGVSAELNGVVMSVERTVLRYDPELSFSIAAPLTTRRED